MFFKRLSTAEASESSFMRERVKIKRFSIFLLRHQYSTISLLFQSQKPLAVELMEPSNVGEDVLVYQSVIDAGHVRLTLKPVISPR